MHFKYNWDIPEVPAGLLKGRPNKKDPFFSEKPRIMILSASEFSKGNIFKTHISGISIQITELFPLYW